MKKTVFSLAGAVLFSLSLAAQDSASTTTFKSTTTTTTVKTTATAGSAKSETSATTASSSTATTGTEVSEENRIPHPDEIKLDSKDAWFFYWKSEYNDVVEKWKYLHAKYKLLYESYTSKSSSSSFSG
ncbi:MAG TPA: hypothetical protein PL048_17165, partial [Leptospiraceae bacterium]|nr:hypothetical protein [Leptospiraceae bacterium]